MENNENDISDHNDINKSSISGISDISDKNENGEKTSKTKTPSYKLISKIKKDSETLLNDNLNNNINIIDDHVVDNNKYQNMGKTTLNLIEPNDEPVRHISEVIYNTEALNKQNNTRNQTLSTNSTNITNITNEKLNKTVTLPEPNETVPAESEDKLKGKKNKDNDNKEGEDRDNMDSKSQMISNKDNDDFHMKSTFSKTNTYNWDVQTIDNVENDHTEIKNKISELIDFEFKKNNDIIENARID